MEIVHMMLAIPILIVLLFVTLHRPFYGLLAWIFFSAYLNSWVEIPLGAGLPDLSFGRLVLLFLIIGMIGKFRFRPFSLTDMCILALVIGMSFSISSNDDSAQAFQIILSHYFIPLSAYFFAKRLVNRKKNLDQFLWVISLFGISAAIYTIYEFTTGHVLFVPEEKVLGHFFRGESNLRNIQGLIGNSSSMGRVLASTILVSLYLLLEGTRLNLRTMALSVMLLIQSGGLVLTFSRSPMVALMFSLLIWSFFYPRFRRYLTVVGVVGLLVLGASWQQFSQSRIFVDRINEKVDSFNGRTPRWSAALEMWKARPVQGWGRGAFLENSGDFRTDGRMRDLTSFENEYLEILVETGMLGFLPYLLFMLTILCNGLRLLTKVRSPRWCGFITANTLALAWAVMICFLLSAFAGGVTAMVLMLPCAIAGAIVGSHEDRLHYVQPTWRMVSVEA